MLYSVYDTHSFFRCECTETLYIYYTEQYVPTHIFCVDLKYFANTKVNNMYLLIFLCRSRTLYFNCAEQYVPYQGFRTTMVYLKHVT